MTFRNIALATAALGLAATPVMAEATVERTQPVAETNELGAFAGGSTIFYVLGLAAVVAGIIIIADDDDDDSLSA
ncbi:hypothetical protein PF049_05465 [Erythrobacteraceae bacterium WH01K]|nr:hypothetical protein PF049_05465 [Erythrobacteraceae bacterium WH01K]